MPSVLGSTEEGIASWYGHPYHGRRTANGEIYDQEQMTAAHPSLPFNTWVRVDNLDNGLRTKVRINDRGPFVKGRAIDLSRAAAREIAMLGPGTAKVRVVVVEAPASGEWPRQPSGSEGRPATPSLATAMPNSGEANSPQSEAETYVVQFGAFQNHENALRLRDRVSRFLRDARVVKSASSPSLWLVWGGTALSLEAAERLVQDLGADFPRIFLLPAH